MDESGRPQPLGVMYRVRIKLSDELVGAAPGQVVNVAIAGRAQSVGTRLGRWLGSTFRFGWAD
jgi:hypothetical protein